MADPGLVAKVLARCVRNPETGCLEWQGGASSKGYGRVRYDGKLVSPHRVMLEHRLGRRLPRHIFACHHCDNPRCVDASHLFAGTRSDNMQDAMRKGRLHPPRPTHDQRRRIALANQARAQPRCPGCNWFIKAVGAVCIKCAASVPAKPREAPSQLELQLLTSPGDPTHA